MLSNKLQTENKNPMQKSRLIGLLKGLEATEIKEVNKFLMASYFNSKKKCVELYAYLIRYYPNFDDSKLEKAAVFYKLFPEGQRYEDSNMRKLMSDLSKLIEQFFIFKELSTNKEQQQLLLANAYVKRKLNKELHLTIKKILSKKEIPHIRFYLNRFLLCWKLYESEWVKSTAGYQYFTDCLQYLDLFFAHSKLKLGLEYYNLTKRYSLQTPIFLVKAAKKFAKVDLNPECYVLRLYTNFLDLIEQKETSLESFNKIHSYLQKSIPVLEKEDANDILNALYNYANAQVGKGKKEFRTACFELLKTGATKSIFIQNGIFPNTIFLNICIAGSRQYQFAWIEQFIKKNQRFLLPKKRELTLQQCQSYIEFYKGIKDNQVTRLELALNILQQLHPSSLEDNIRVNMQMLRTLYELFSRKKTAELLEAIHKKSHAFEKFASRNKQISPAKKEAIIQFSQLIRKLASLKIDPNFHPSLLKKIRDKAHQKDRFISNWVIEKVEEFDQCYS